MDMGSNWLLRISYHLNMQIVQLTIFALIRAVIVAELTQMLELHG